MKQWTCPICNKIYMGWSEINYCEECGYLEGSEDILKDIGWSLVNLSRRNLSHRLKKQICRTRNKVIS